MRFPILLCAIALASLGVSACAIGESPSPAGFFAPPNTIDATASTGPSMVSPDADASETTLAVGAQPPAHLYMGSPLCNFTPLSVCSPDNLASNPTTAEDCHTAPDGGAYDPDGGYADAGLACRVTMSDAGPLPQCSTSGPNQDGASCHLSTDCAVGDECVGDPGICRHYCCSGTGPCTATQF